MQKLRSGATLTADEQAYLDRARAAMRARAGGPAGAAPAPTASTGLVPLDQMTAQDRYKGEDGGLYGAGMNTPPPELRKAAAREIASIVPRDARGNPSPAGKIVLISMGMSNTTQEFSRFKQLADADPARRHEVVIVDGAQGGRDAVRWTDKGLDDAWKTFDDRLRAADVTREQVQAAWVKHACIGPASLGEFPRHAEQLKTLWAATLNLARQRMPNLRLAFLSSRIYAGYASTALNPEPYAYESAFSVRWLIRDQAKGDPNLNCDPARGQVTAPLLLWGPYLWADGTTPRKSDGLIWNREDLAGDGTHPSPAAGREKVAALLLKFFKTDPSGQPWFARPAADKAAGAP
ncbi:MAG: hypothetical protein FJ288_13685 [Planctomycetes bacterium]|nr:hypothetical protein [Planctomycetota bacterium]